MHPLTDTEVYQETHYYPFGMTMEGEWQNIVNGPENKYLYNGKELESDLGLDWLMFEFRSYDAAIGRFTGVDPIADEFAFVNPFNYAENSPIGNIDLWGLQAWSINDKWNEEHMDKFQEFSAEKADEYKNARAYMTCEDLACNLLIDYASENGLPVNIVNGAYPDGLSASSEDFDDVKGFRNEVLKTMGAPDVVNNTIETGIGLEGLGNAEPGNIITLDTNGNGVSDNHVQIITKVDSESKEVTGVQGNQGLGRSDPSSYFYAGKRLKQIMWFLSTDTYKGTGGSTNAEEDYKPSIRIWDINQLNEN